MAGVEKLREHICSIAQTHEIIIEWTERPLQAWAARQADTVSIPRVTSPATYAIGLHEFGHILGRYQSSRVTLVRERWAWAWARANALEWTTEMDRLCAKALSGEFKPPERRASGIRLPGPETFMPAKGKPSGKRKDQVS